MKNPMRKTTIDDLFLDDASIGFAINDAETGKVLAMNKEFERIYELENKKIRNVEDFLDYVYQRDYVAKEYVKKLVSDPDINKQVWKEFPVRLPSGRKKFIDARNLKNKQGTVVYSIAEDVTRRVKYMRVTELTSKLLNALNSGRNKDVMYDMIANFVQDTFDVHNCYIAILNEEKNFLHFEYFRDEKDYDVEDRQLSKGITEYFIKKNRTELLNTKDLSVLKNNDELEHIGTLPEQFLGSPLRINNEVLGVLAIQSYYNKNALTSHDMPSFELLSQEIASILKTNRYLSELEEKNETIIENQKLADDNLNQVLHDLKNPLSSAIGILDLLRTEDSLTSEEKDKLLYSAGKGLLGTIDRLEKRVFTSRNVIKRNEKFYLNEIIEHALEDLRYHIGEKNIQIITDIEPVKIDYVETLVNFSLRNFISNAIKFSPEKSCVYISAKAKQDFVELKVGDEGKGMSYEDIKRIQNGKITRSSSHNGNGSGFGLNNTIEYFNKDNIKYELKSYPGKGTEWKVYFPKAK